MGKLKQLHIDCTPEQCVSPNTNSTVCPMWADENMLINNIAGRTILVQYQESIRKVEVKV